MRTALLALGGFVLLAAVQPAAAQQITSPYRFIETSHSVGAYLGYLWTGSGDPDLGPQSAPIIGIRYQGRLTGGLNGEVAVSFAPSERTIFANEQDPTDPSRLVPVPQGDAGVPLLLTEGALQFHVTGPRTWNGLAPFVLASLGLAIDLGGTDRLEEEAAAVDRFDFGPGLAVGVGLGTDYFLSDRFSVNLEVRDRLWRLVVPQGLANSGREESNWKNNPSISIGAAVHF
jgi:opacity protein-like surface antigen